MAEFEPYEVYYTTDDGERIRCKAGYGRGYAHYLMDEVQAHKEAQRLMDSLNVKKVEIIPVRASHRARAHVRRTGRNR